MPDTPVRNPFHWFTAEQIASATGCPLEAVRANWPRLHEQLTHAGIADRPVQLAMIGNVAHETASRFAPIREFKNADGSIPAHWHGYGGGAEYHGRGFIQLTHKSNYEKYARKVAELWGTELVPEIDFGRDPELALDPDLSAANAACYFRDHGGDGKQLIPQAARRGDWAEVRRLIWGANPLDFPVGHFGRDAHDKIVRTIEALDGVKPDRTEYVFPVAGYTGAVNLHWGSHPGATDIFAPQGTRVLAIHSGVVVYRAVDDPLGGNAVQIQGFDGLQSYYAHGDRAPAFHVGQSVKAGDVLFGVGDTGNAKSAGPHLHFGMGKEILTGSGPAGGAGSDFDAVDLLRRIQSRPSPIPVDPRDAEIAHLKALLTEANTKIGVLTVDYAARLAASLDQLKALWSDVTRLRNPT